MKRFIGLFLLMNVSVQGNVLDNASDNSITITNGTDQKYRVTIFVADRTWAPLKSEVLGEDQSIHAHSVVAHQYTVIMQHIDIKDTEPTAVKLPPGSYRFDGKHFGLRVWSGVPAQSVVA